LKRYEDRAEAVIDKLRIEVRTNSGELQQAAKIMADRLNASKAPAAVLIPLRGWSSLDQEGAALFDPAADRAFVETLKAHLNEKVAVEEVDLHLNTREFGEKAVALFDRLYRQFPKQSS
jgi:uncharacterized protein (UPF0261 family)